MKERVIGIFLAVSAALFFYTLLIDGELDQPRVLHTNSFHTLKAYNFINVTATQTSVLFEY